MSSGRPDWISIYSWLLQPLGRRFSRLFHAAMLTQYQGRGRPTEDPLPEEVRK
jgi:hypothetical protein